MQINDKKEERFFLRSGSALVNRGFAERPSRKNKRKIRDCSQSITCVSSYMLLKRAKAREHFFTLSTLVRFILAVYRHMDFEVGGACKAPATFITFKRLLS